MTWSKTDYPEPMRRLNDDTRNRAIDIANKLVADGWEENVAIQLAIDRSEYWSHHRGEPSDMNEDQLNYKNRGENR